MQMRNPINQESGRKMRTAPLSEICVGSLFVGIQTVPCVTETARPSSNVIKEPATSLLDCHSSQAIARI